MGFVESVIALFSGMGLLWLLLALFIIIFIDALIFPMLPEVAVLLVYAFGVGQVQALAWGALVLLVVVVAEVSGTSSLYYLAKRARLPGFIKRKMNAYVDILLVKDERLVLINRVVPVLPVLGAFIAVRGWSISRSIVYVVIGSVAKYGAILLFASWAILFFRSSLSLYVSLGAVLAMICLSLLASYAYRRRAKGSNDRI
jgi:membrane protein YqaA with SNARE-associated domain